MRAAIASAAFVVLPDESVVLISTSSLRMARASRLCRPASCAVAGDADTTAATRAIRLMRIPG
jgi:hypothetical protein